MSLDDPAGRLRGEPLPLQDTESHAMPASVVPVEGASVMTSDLESNHHDMVGEPTPGTMATTLDVAGAPHATGDGLVEPPLASPSRRPRFRDRPADWWLRGLRRTDATRNTGRDARDPHLQHAAPESEEHAHLTEEQPDKTAVEDVMAESAQRQPVRVAPPVTGGARITSGVRARRLRGLVAAIIALFLLGIAVSRLLGTGGSAAPAAPTSPAATLPAATPPAGVFAPVAAAPVAPRAALGGAAKLVLPREAIALTNGHIVVADTGNSRLVILDAAGHVLQVVRRGGGAFQQPFAIAPLSPGFVVLDAARGSLDLFSADGAFMHELMHSQQLVDARGLAAGPHDQLYVANPRSNSILVLSRDGRVVRTFTGPLSAAPGGLNQPSDVAVAADGALYLLDNVNNRVEALTPTGTFIKQWPAPGSDTIFSAHVLPLPGGRLIVSDPTGALTVYTARGGQPARVPLAASGQSATVEPIGLSTAQPGTILVTDARGGRLLLIPLSKLPH